MLHLSQTLLDGIDDDSYMVLSIVLNMCYGLCNNTISVEILSDTGISWYRDMTRGKAGSSQSLLHLAMPITIIVDFHSFLVLAAKTTYNDNNSHSSAKDACWGYVGIET